MRQYEDPVEVCRDVGTGPEQLLWRGRRWKVRDKDRGPFAVVAHRRLVGCED
jgi:hypothetical protein